MGTNVTCLVAADAASLVRFQNDENDGRAEGGDGDESILGGEKLRILKMLSMPSM